MREVEVPKSHNHASEGATPEKLARALARPIILKRRQKVHEARQPDTVSDTNDNEIGMEDKEKHRS